MEELKWEMGNAMKDVPPNVVGTLKGSIIAKADKMSVKDAIEFIEDKMTEGLIDKNIAGDLIYIVKKYSTYR